MLCNWTIDVKDFRTGGQTGTDGKSNNWRARSLMIPENPTTKNHGSADLVDGGRPLEALIDKLALSIREILFFRDYG